MDGCRSKNAFAGLRCFIVLGWLLAGSLCFVQVAGAGTNAHVRNVLYLNSYHPGFRWSDDISRAVGDVFQVAGGSTRLFIEYLDAKRRDPEEMGDKTRQILRLKYPPGFFDLILSSDDAAFDFLRQSHEELFGKTPIVFCGVNDLESTLAPDWTGMVGYREDVDISGTLDLALHLHPDTRQVFIIGDRTLTGRKILRKIRREQIRLKDRASLHVLPDKSVSDLVDRLRRLPPHSLVLFTQFARDASGRFYEFDEVLPILVRNCRVPIYGTWDFHLGQGIVGGKLVSGYRHGQRAAQLGLKILQGQPLETLPPVGSSESRYRFDMQQLQRFDIAPDRLPSDSYFINQELPLPDRYRVILLESLTAILILTGIILLLLRIISLRKRTQTALEKSRRQLESEVQARTAHLSEANQQLRMQILERNWSARALEESESEKGLILDSSSDLIAYLDIDLRIRWANRKSMELTGRKLGDVQGQFCYTAWHGLDEPCIGCPMLRARKTGLPQHGEIVSPDGKIWLERGFPLFDGQGRVTGFASFCLDVTEQKKAQRAIHRLAYYDHLTGLPNRVLFQKELDRCLEEAVGRGVGLALMFLDLDHFKGVNDSLGHAKGDLLLQKIADRLQSCLNTEDTLARLNGDEFIFLLTEVDDPQAVVAIADRVLQIMAEPFNLDGDEIYVGASIGIACYPIHGVDARNLIKRADRALYAAKERGRNAITLFSEEINARFHRRQQLELRLQHALSRNEFFLEYQPQVDLGSGRVIGVEALLRWQNSDLGLVMPGDFIPIAEETGLIRPIGEWVLRTACREYLSWSSGPGVPLRLSINISGQQIKHPDFVPIIDDVLKTTGFDARLLELEITESVAMEDVESNIRTFSELKGRRLLLAIDDFGTGYSSLSHLHHFPIDRLKIDRRFIRDLAVSRDSALLVEAIIGMARSLHLELIAEGVETTEQVACLWEQGCLQAQGNYFGKPMRSADLLAHLQEVGIGNAAVRPRACG